MDQQVALSCGMWAHCFDGVDDQIDYHLSQLISIALNQRQGLCQFHLHRDAVHHELIVGYAYGLEGQGVDVQAFPPWRRLRDQRTGSVDDVPGAHSVLDDTIEQPPDCFRIRRLGEEQRQSGFGVHDDGADRLVDFANRRR